MGLERTGGFKTVWQVEKDGYARRVLEKHWPNVRRWDDVRTFPPVATTGNGRGTQEVGRKRGIGNRREDFYRDWRCDLICGGFPCTNISASGDCTGITGAESGLWFEMLRVIRVLGPRFVLLENVADIVHRGLGAVLGGLAETGYDAEWTCLPAAAFGSPQRRDRLFVVAYRPGSRFTFYPKHYSRPQTQVPKWQEGWDYSDGLALAEHRTTQAASVVCGMDDAVPHRTHRLRCLGNAVVPQVSEYIGNRILEHEQTLQ